MRATMRPSLVIVAATLTAALGLSGCVLHESSDYVIQPAPPKGLHITIQAGPTAMLHVVSDMVMRNQDIDHWLRLYGSTTRCNASRGTRERGNRCAFAVLQDSKIEGNLAVTTIGRKVWGEATKDSEFADFANDAMAPTRNVEGSCVHVTVREYGDWPVSWWNANWTMRSRSDSHCN